jgi:SpoVK/Ycf46/Vps4 family AAA+-type ATPase
LQLTGKPGIGKSKLVSLFIKYLFEHPEYLIYQDKLKIARVVDNSILANDDFWVAMRQGGFSAVILDDLDNILEKRVESYTTSEDKMHNEIIKKLLSFTDGLMNSKIKILITTNVEYSKIDEALLRDMRLFDLLELRPLKYEEALNIWVKHYKLDEKSFNTIFTDLTEITPAKLAAQIDARVNNKKEINTNKRASYLKEDNISKVEKLNSRKRRIGFG